MCGAFVVSAWRAVNEPRRDARRLRPRIVGARRDVRLLASDQRRGVNARRSIRLSFFTTRTRTHRQTERQTDGQTSISAKRRLIRVFEACRRRAAKRIC